MVETGVIHGRFQLLHLKHVEYILAAKMRCQKLYIGITNPDDSYTKISARDGNRSTKKANPFTYYERFRMIHDTMIDFGVPREDFEIIPFPINRPEYILQYAPKEAMFYMSIFDAWDREKYKVLTEDLGLDVDVLWEKPLEEKGITGTEVRTLIANGDEWSPLVPKTVYEYIIENRMDRRIQKMKNE